LFRQIDECDQPPPKEYVLASCPCHGFVVSPKLEKFEGG
jgi:hypothetical protein